MPFSSYIPYVGSPCDGVYKSGEDYVFVKHDQQFLENLRMIVDVEDELESTVQQDNCVPSTIRLMCQYYLPSCGDRAGFRVPLPVCVEECNELSEKCPIQWNSFLQKALLDCSAIQNISDNLFKLCPLNGGQPTRKLVNIYEKLFQIFWFRNILAVSTILTGVTLLYSSHVCYTVANFPTDRVNVDDSAKVVIPAATVSAIVAVGLLVVLVVFATLYFVHRRRKRVTLVIR